MILIDVNVKAYLNTSYILWLQPLYCSYSAWGRSPGAGGAGPVPGQKREWLSPNRSHGYVCGARYAGELP